MSVLVESKILRPFVNTLTPDDKYSLNNKEMFPQPIQLILSEKLNVFVKFLLHFWKLYLIFNVLK